LRKRPAKGLLGGMMEVPTTSWGAAVEDDATLAHAPLKAKWRKLPGAVEHTFTHFHLQLAIFEAKASARAAKDAEGIWVGADELGGEALPSVMRKVVNHAMPDLGPLFAKTMK
jgi:A/G-specific adenine glycosylase